jgi:phosphatidate cytidylyltransferase
LISAALILVPLVGLFVADYHYSLGAPGLLLIPLLLLFSLLAASEILAMLKSNDHVLAAWSVYSGVAVVVLATCAPLGWSLIGGEYPADCPLGKLGWPLVAGSLAVGLAFIGEMVRYREPGGVIVRVALSTFVALYIGISFAFLASLRFFHSNEWGMAALVSLLFVTKLLDVGAYTFGKLLGRHKLAPRLSPGKTIEGAIGGIAAACLASWVFFQFISPMIVGPGTNNPTPLWGSLAYGLLISLAGMLGDLSESLLKRDLSVKDSSRWLLGLGGILDILDSVLAAAPVAFLCWAAGVVGPA